MTSDRELLELAAKAEGRNLAGWKWRVGGFWSHAGLHDDTAIVWNPLADGGDALRLAVNLRLEVAIHETYSGVINGNLIGGHVQHGDDPYAATRRAIVRLAAAIGKEMQ